MIKRLLWNSGKEQAFDKIFFERLNRGSIFHWRTKASVSVLCVNDGFLSKLFLSNNDSINEAQKSEMQEDDKKKKTITRLNRKLTTSDDAVLWDDYMIVFFYKFIFCLFGVCLLRARETLSRLENASKMMLIKTTQRTTTTIVDYCYYNEF